MTFSFIIPAYNCQEWLSEAIESLIQQDIGFLDSVEVIVVDDGSTDGTPLIADQFAVRYPSNIRVLHQINSGVSAARTAGLQLATGEIVGFLDADDKWSPDICTEAQRFFQNHTGVDMCTARHQFFEGSTGTHALSFKFEENRVVDLDEDPEFIHLSVNNALFRRAAAAKLEFDPRLSISEDFLAVNLQLLDNHKYGILSKPVYWYRKRDAGGSAIDQSARSRTWYLDTPKYCYERLFEESISQYGKVLPFIQISVMYDLQWRIKRKAAHPLTQSELQDYRSRIVNLLKEIDDEVILTRRNMATWERLLALALKEDTSYRNVQNRLYANANGAYLRSTEGTPLKLANLDELKALRIDFIEENDGRIAFEGHVRTPFPIEKVRVLCVSDAMGDKPLEARLFERRGNAYNSFFERGYACPIGFRIEVPAGNVSFAVEFDGQMIPASLRSTKFCPLSFRRFDYAKVGRYMILSPGKDRSRLRIAPYAPARAAIREALFETGVAIKKPAARKVLRYRRFALKQQRERSHRKDSVWLIMDRTTLAGDNGEALFRYLTQHPIAGVTPYFVLNEDSPDYKRMAEIGPVAPFGSEEHIRLHLQASLIVSSAADDYIFKRFEKYNWLLKGLEPYRFVFLQHGVIHNDLSGWLNRYNKNISLFITSAYREWDSIAHTFPYGYVEEQVVLTGMPRHDALLAAPKPTAKRILIAPTWRSYLASESDPETGKRRPVAGFENTNYYRFFQGLLNDERLREAASNFGWEVDFLIHPAMEAAADAFTSGFCNVLSEYSYREQLSGASILVTDYSSVAFDFALLQRPIVYTQFDYDEFFAGHQWGHGYFDYEKDGFGPVCTNIQQTVDSLCSLMEEANMPPEYRSRVDAFFPKIEGSRCARALDAITSLNSNEVH